MAMIKSLPQCQATNEILLTVPPCTSGGVHLIGPVTIALPVRLGHLLWAVMVCTDKRAERLFCLLRTTQQA